MMSDEEKDSVAMAECGACRTVIPLDSTECPECNTKFSGVSDEALGECGACNKLVPLDSTRCPECGVVFVADDVVDILRTWIGQTGINIRKLFDKFDEDNDGTIDSSELKEGLLSLNLADLPPSQVERLVAEIDADGNGVIDLDEFETILTGEDPEVDESNDVQNTTQDEEPSSEAEPTESPTGEEEPSDEGEDESASHEDEAEETPSEEHDASEDSVPAALVVGAIDDVDDDDDAGDDEDDADADVDGIENEEFELDEVEDAESESINPLAALAEKMDENDISAQRMFTDLDADGNGMISLGELKAQLLTKHADVISEEEVEAMMDSIDSDGDGMIDVTEFIGSLENLEDHEEALEAHRPEREFPTPMQKRMMSKTWNDSVWPIIHVGFGILIALVLVNALIGPVDGSGGAIEFVPVEGGVIPSGLAEGDVYPCDEKYQEGGCPNSLTILAGENGASSMPKGFYWDGVLLLVLSLLGMASSLFLHLVKAPAWRARAKAMREFDQDKSEAQDEAQENEEGEEPEHETDSNDDDGDEHESTEGDNDDEDVQDESDDDAIDIGSHIGLVFDDEEVFGTILEFDDDEGTVTIEEDGTGDLVTGYQEDMFVE